ncbi:MAG: bifunctional 2-C-methyl-D-erythritol 4-phosphate cytidylyltransferase/2-C-methyl-D-erythritol 2,4-cyclodiphosphate synthase [Alphaproteobacteria bacterium]|nr:bifunctional 2-C-methyl-D-erythritol 4-phosphate cytidylyltransferase/2-C-methyl-D-erythritol 2,4-cyclodiphosphate synthase [Alphaproteobacteria bacterium]
MPGAVALIVAAGRGARFGAGADGTAKQYRRLGGRPLLARAVQAFAEAEGIDAVRVVIHEDDRALYDDAVGHMDLLAPVVGGATRQDSVRLGLESLADDGFQTVLIHDAVRPLVDAGVIARVLAALATHAGAVPALAAVDSLARAADGIVTDIVPRDALWRAQTPQGFAFAAILAAHRDAQDQGQGDFSDDAAVATWAGLEVAVVAGSEDNLKITTEDDLARAERLLAAAGGYRLGQGFDVHAFGPEGSGPLRLGGIDLPFDRGLGGHSDADAVLHAVTDAILGALAEGDIGSHFPPGDPAWKDADSARFLGFARDRLGARGGRVSHVDVTIICERPKIAPHRDDMRRRLAELLETETDRISIKATTTEGLGALGKGDGIAAQAAVTVFFEGPAR